MTSASLYMKAQGDYLQNRRLQFLKIMSLQTANIITITANWSDLAFSLFIIVSFLWRDALMGSGLQMFRADTQLAFYVNLHRAVIGPSATLTGRWRPDKDLRRMLTGYCLCVWYVVKERDTGLQFHNVERTLFLRRQQCRTITKTCLFKYIENFTSKTWKFSDEKLWYFSYFFSKHRLWVLVRTALTRRF